MSSQTQGCPTVRAVFCATASATFLRRIAGVAVALALGLMLGGCSQQAVPPEPIRAVKLQTVGMQPLVAHPEFAGDIRARVESPLGFRVAGKVLSRDVQLGQTVKPGQLLAQLDGADYALAVHGAQAQVQAAVTQRDLAAANWQRFGELHQKNFISAAEMQRHTAELEAAQAQLEQAKAHAAAQSNQNAYTRLVADVAGVVTAVYVEPGQVVAAGAPVLRIARDGARDAVFAVPEDHVGAWQVGQPVQVRLWPGAQAFSAHIREVAASADAATRTYQIKASVDAASPGAWPPLGATVVVVPQGLPAAVGTAANAIKLPLSALWEKDGSSHVWVFNAASATVKPQAVHIERVDGNEAIVSSGLAQGTQVVVAGVHVLSNGQKVSVFESKYALVPVSKSLDAVNSVVADLDATAPDVPDASDAADKR